MKNSERLAIIAILICTPVISFCSVAGAGVEPNAVELVRAVRESENWLHRIDSLKLRINGKWSRSPESIAARYAKLRKQYPDKEPDPNSNWDLKPSYPDILKYAIDFKRKRLRYVEEIPGREYCLKIWDGRQAMRYIRVGRDIQQDIDSTTKMFNRLFGSISWPRTQPHSFWWEPLYVDERMGYFGLAEDFKITGLQEYRGVMCHVLECISYLDAPVTIRWYVGIEDHLLYGRKEWRNPQFVFEYWTLDYKQIAPGCKIPMTQGYSIPAYNPITKKRYIDGVRDVRIVEVRINDKLPDELFEMKFEEGRTVVDNRSGMTVAYKYIATPPSLVGKPLPDFENIRINFNPKKAKGKMLLVCFWDMNQRPSRNCIMRLSKKLQELKERDVVVLTVHASKIERDKLDSWIKDSEIDLAVGFITDQEKKVRFNWGVRSLPWLILTDKQHIVIAEDFSVTELDNKIPSARE